MIPRIAASLARNPSPEHRWRRFAVPATAALFTLLALAAASVVMMTQRELERSGRRTGLAATTPAPSDLLVVSSWDGWRGQQFTTVWLEPAGNAPPVLPPGVARLPEPGEAVLSPELARLASQHAELAARYPRRLVLQPEGVARGGELLAYVRAPEGRSLAGDEDTYRLRAFGTPAVAERPFRRLFILFEPVPLSGLLPGLLAFLVLPGLLALAAGVAAASGVRDHRFGVLRALGAPGRTLLALALIETLLLALPGIVAAGLLWQALASRLSHVPLVGQGVVRGDLALPWPLFLGLLLACVVATALVALGVSAWRERRGAGRPRPTHGGTGVSPLRFAPLVSGVALLLLGWYVVPRAQQGTVLLAGLTVLILAAPVLLPTALRAAGRGLADRGPVEALVAGRGLEWDPVRSARPYAGAAALMVIALLGSGYLAGLLQPPAPPAELAGAQAVKVAWAAPRPGDPARLKEALGAEFVAPLDGRGNALVIGATCPQLAPYFPGAACRPGRPYELPRRVAARLRGLLLAVGQPIRLQALGGAPDGALVLGDGPLSELHERTQIAAMRTLPAPNLYSRQLFGQRQSPLVPWIFGGILAAGLALAPATVISMVDRLLGTRAHRRHLLNLGVVARRLMKLELWMFAAPYGVSVAVSFLIGFGLCALVVRGFGVGIPWGLVVGALGVALGLGLLGAASVALFGVRRTVREPSQDAR